MNLSRLMSEQDSISPGVATEKLVRLHAWDSPAITSQNFRIEQSPEFSYWGECSGISLLMTYGLR